MNAKGFIARNMRNNLRVGLGKKTLLRTDPIVKAAKECLTLHRHVVGANRWDKPYLPAAAVMTPKTVVEDQSNGNDIQPT